jgi:NADH-quinone oxidoreductase subunit J
MVSLQYLVLRAPFLAVIQVLVYAGAIMVLFLFVLMLLNLSADDLREDASRRRKVVAGLGCGALFALLATAVMRSGRVEELSGQAGLTADVPAAVAEAGELQAIAETLFQEHVLPFELTSFLILIAIVGAIYMTKARGRARAERSAEPARAAEGEAAAAPVLSQEGRT